MEYGKKIHQIPPWGSSSRTYKEAAKKLDTIPPSLKEYFYTRKKMPNFFDEKGEAFDAVGFDADHCLVKYNLPNFYRLIIETGL